MRLINVHTLELEEFWGRDPPAYGIASHTWGSEEVSFQEWKDRASISHKAGYHKIVEMAQLAMAFGLNYVWVDTNCIDKTSSAELSEAINSMFNWYAAARQCFVYFDDVASTQREEASDYNSESLQDARWFTRGWTLQELIAPGHLVFLSQNWQIIGDLSKTDTPNPRSVESKIAVDISVITGIDQEVLHVREEYKKRSIAARMHWASRRKTTRVEDMAYCLLGLFKINMPLLYGEGKTAFQRLQEEIMKVSIDQSIFAWSYETVDEDQERISLMAPWPSAFTNGTIIKTKASRAPIDSVYTMTNFGLSVQFPLLVSLGRKHYIAVLECTDILLSSPELDRLCILLRKSENNDDTYIRPSSSKSPVALHINNIPPPQRLHFPRLNVIDRTLFNLCSHCETRNDYAIIIFVAAKHSVSRLTPLKAKNQRKICNCQHILLNAPASPPCSTEISVSLYWKDETTAITRSKGFIFNIKVDFRKNLNFLYYDLKHDLSNEVIYGQADIISLREEEWTQQEFRGTPIFLNFAKTGDSRTAMFPRTGNVGETSNSDHPQ